jgi:hypothetical protein
MAIETAKMAAARRGAFELITGTVDLLLVDEPSFKDLCRAGRLKESPHTCAEDQTTLGVA